MENERIVGQLLDAIGGGSNVKNFEHCATRLRIVLKDDSLLDKDKAENITGLQGYFFSTGQHQFVFGTGKVNEVYNAFANELGTADIDTSKSVKEDAYANMNPVQRVVRVLADILLPLIPVLVTTGLLMGIRGLLLELGMELSDDAMGLFTVLTDTAFAFLPVFITYSATRKFGGNPILGIAVGIMLVSPVLPNAYQVASGDATPLNILGINIQGYQGSIFPGIIAGWLISWLERQFRKFVPQAMDLIVTPFLTITLTLLVMLFGLGPVISLVEDIVINFIVRVINAPFGIGYAIFGGLQQLLVVTGLHHSLSIIELSLLDDTGRNVLNTLMTASMAGQFGAALAVATIVKDKVKKSNLLGSASSTLFGITEPLLFGVNLRSMNVLFAGVIGGVIGGFLTYFLNVSASGMGITFIPGLLLYTDSMSSLLGYLAVIAAAMLTAFLIVRGQAKSIRPVYDREEEVVESILEENENVYASGEALDAVIIGAPLEGQRLSMSEIPDPVFASGAMGPAVAIEPANGEVVAPFDGEVMLVADTKHAIGLRSDEGIEILIHVGLDTVELNGTPFDVRVRQGERVSKGQTLMQADLDAIKAAGKFTITPIVMTNGQTYSKVTPTINGQSLFEVEA